MLQSPFGSYLTPEDLALLFRVLAKLEEPGDSAIDREARTAAVIRLFQSGISEKEELIHAMANRCRA